MPVLLDDVVGRSAAPGAAELALARIVEHRPGVSDRLEADPALARAVVTVVSASRSLTRLLVKEPEAIETLADLDRRRALTAAGPGELVRWKQLEFLRIAARDLLGRDGLREVGAAAQRGLNGVAIECRATRRPQQCGGRAGAQIPMQVRGCSTVGPMMV